MVAEAEEVNGRRRRRTEEDGGLGGLPRVACIFGEKEKMRFFSQFIVKTLEREGSARSVSV